MNLDVPCTVAEAAEWFKVSKKTINTWVYRYGITSVGGRGKQARLYRFSDLNDADRRARGLPPLGTVADD